MAARSGVHSPSAELRGVVSGRDWLVRHDVQDAPGRAHCLDRRLGRRRYHRIFIYRRTILDRTVSRQDRRRLGIRRRRIVGHPLGLVYYSAQIFLFGAEFT